MKTNLKKVFALIFAVMFVFCFAACGEKKAPVIGISQYGEHESLDNCREGFLQGLKDAGVDTLILGCTHYPLLKKMIGDFMGDAVRLVDSGKVTAQATAAALADLGLLNGKTDGGTAHYYVSDTPDNFAELEQMFLGEYAGGPVERIAIETY